MATKFTKGYDAMYSFKYNPKFKEVLPEWDKHPLVYPLDIRGTRTLGLNLHWVPLKFRFKFISFLLDLNKKKLMNRKKLTRIVYETIKNTPALRPALQGVRLYINSRISNTQIIDRKEIGKFMLVRPRYRAHKVKNPRRR